MTVFLRVYANMYLKTSQIACSSISLVKKHAMLCCDPNTKHIKMAKLTGTLVELNSYSVHIEYFRLES